MARKNKDFLQTYLEYTANTESPTSYHVWSAIGIISGALERRVFMRWGHSQIFANQYIVLIGPSGRARKGEPITIARSMLEDTGCNIVAESIIREALIRRMKKSAKEYINSEGKMVFQCPVNVVAEELSVFLGENNIKLLADLTNWWDSRDTWTYETKNQGIDSLHGVCFNLLGSMAPDWIPTTIPHGAIGGGFTSRIIFIVEHRKRASISNPNLTDAHPSLRESLLYDLEQIHQITGEFIFDGEALREYEEWYLEQERQTDAGKPALRDPRFEGYVSRRATHVKKIAMALSASRSNNLVVTAFDFHRALKLLTDAEGHMEDVFGRVGKAAYTEQMQDVIEYIKNRGRAKKSDILKHLYRDLDEPTLRIIEGTLLAMDAITIDYNKPVTYIWNG